MVSRHLERAARLLSGQAGIIVDTSGYVADSHQLELLRELRIPVRISIDAERPSVNDKMRAVRLPADGRPGGGGALRAALRTLTRAQDLGLSVTVQSVAYDANLADLEALGDKLCRLGVRSWRVLKIQFNNDRLDAVARLAGSARRYKFYFGQLEKAYRTRWEGRMAFQATYNSSPNSVILVAPDGRFVTESDRGCGKIDIDDKHPFRPRLEAVFTKVNPWAHAARYLNATHEFEV